MSFLKVKKAKLAVFATTKAKLKFNEHHVIENCIRIFG